MEKKGNILLGIFGAFLGGMIGTIPWILVYVFGNMMFSLLAVIIAWLALIGYRMLKGPETEKLPVIIVVISILSVSLANLVIIPLIMLYQGGYDVSFYNLKILYQTQEFVSGIMKDYAIAVIFTGLGIASVIKEIKSDVKKQINNSVQ